MLTKRQASARSKRVSRNSQVASESGKSIIIMIHHDVVMTMQHNTQLTVQFTSNTLANNIFRVYITGMIPLSINIEVTRILCIVTSQIENEQLQKHVPD